MAPGSLEPVTGGPASEGAASAAPARDAGNAASTAIAAGSATFTERGAAVILVVTGVALVVPAASAKPGRAISSERSAVSPALDALGRAVEIEPFIAGIAGAAERPGVLVPAEEVLVSDVSGAVFPVASEPPVSIPGTDAGARVAPGDSAIVWPVDTAGRVASADRPPSAATTTDGSEVGAPLCVPGVAVDTFTGDAAMETPADPIAGPGDNGAPGAEASLVWPAAAASRVSAARVAAGSSAPGAGAPVVDAGTAARPGWPATC